MASWREKRSRNSVSLSLKRAVVFSTSSLWLAGWGINECRRGGLGHHKAVDEQGYAWRVQALGSSPFEKTEYLFLSRLRCHALELFLLYCGVMVKGWMGPARWSSTCIWEGSWTDGRMAKESRRYRTPMPKEVFALSNRVFSSRGKEGINLSIIARGVRWLFVLCINGSHSVVLYKLHLSALIQKYTNFLKIWLSRALRFFLGCRFLRGDVMIELEVWYNNEKDVHYLRGSVIIKGDAQYLRSPIIKIRSIAHSWTDGRSILKKS